MKGTAIVNPAAGGGRCGASARQELAALNAQGFNLNVVFTKGPGHATEIARQKWTEGERCFVAVGGDGTGFEIINGLFPLVGEARPTLGFLTLGTGNSFVRDKGIISQGAAIRALTAQNKHSCDVIRLDYDGGTLHYINLLSIGFSARVASLTNRRFKPLGDAGYAVAVVLSLLQQKHPVIPYQLDDEAFDRSPQTLVSFSNSKFTGGKMMMAPQADFGDGALDVVRIQQISRNRLLRAFPKIYKGTHVTLDVVETRQVRSVTFDVDEAIDIMVDGEVLSVRPLRLEVLPGALEVIL